MITSWASPSRLLLLLLNLPPQLHLLCHLPLRYHLLIPESMLLQMPTVSSSDSDVLTCCLPDTSKSSFPGVLPAPALCFLTLSLFRPVWCLAPSYPHASISVLEPEVPEDELPLPPRPLLLSKPPPWPAASLPPPLPSPKVGSSLCQDSTVLSALVILWFTFFQLTH